MAEMKIIRTSGPKLTPIIPPVTGLLDRAGVVIALDAEVVVNRLMGYARDAKDHGFRARVVGIGDPGLPGRQIVKIRPYGSNYVETAQPNDCIVHVFRDVEWVIAETLAAHAFAERGIDLEKCVFGGFHFEPFQQATCLAYIKAVGIDV